MRNEGSSTGTTLLGLQERGLDLEVPTLGEAAADAGQHQNASARHLTGFGPNDEIDVALPDAGLLR